MALRVQVRESSPLIQGPATVSVRLVWIWRHMVQITQLSVQLMKDPNVDQ